MAENKPTLEELRSGRKKAGRATTACIKCGNLSEVSLLITIRDKDSGRRALLSRQRQMCFDCAYSTMNEVLPEN